MKAYSTPIAQLLALQADDVITASGLTAKSSAYSGFGEEVQDLTKVWKW